MSAGAEMRMLHPSSLLLRLLPHARALLLPGLAVLLLAKGGRWEFWLMLLFLPSASFEWLRYATYRYGVGEGELVISTGLVFRNVRHVPFRRLQTVKVERTVLHRLFGVADVRLETAGGAEPEAVLRAVSVPEAERLSRAALRARADAGGGGRADGDAGAAAAGGETLVLLPSSELVRLGLSSLRGAALFALALAAAWEFDLFDRLGLWDRLRGAMDVGPGGIVRAGAALALGVLVMAPAASVVWTALRFGGYRLRRDGDDFHVSSGVLTQRSATIPRRRIQLLAVHESVVQRWMGRVTVRLETAGGVGEAGEGGAEKHAFEQKWFVPILPAGRAGAVVSALRPGLDPSALEWRPLSARASRRLVKKALVVSALLSLATLVFVRPWGPAVFVAAAPLAVWHARAWARGAGWALSESAVAVRVGVLLRTTTVTFFDKAQTVSLESSPFDRRRGMAAVAVDTAGAGPAGSRVRVPYLDGPVASDLAAQIGARVERTSFRW